MKFTLALPVVYSCFLAACMGDFKLELCADAYCEGSGQKENKKIKVAFENLAGSISIGLSTGPAADDTKTIETKSSDGAAISFNALMGEGEFAKVSVTGEPDDQMCKLKGGNNVVKSSDITEFSQEASPNTGGEECVV